jgi:hypothetical protein
MAPHLRRGGARGVLLVVVPTPKSNTRLSLKTLNEEDFIPILVPIRDPILARKPTRLIV